MGLSWLVEAKKQTGLPVTIEVATSRQVDEALKAGIDMLWIGARTTANPFSVQEVADALAGVDVPVFVKNPTNADLDLWIGAVERVEKAGVNSIGLIHRGFSSYGESKDRNAPMWHLAIEMMRRYPHLSMINDPSHICGNREMLLQVAQKAINLGYHGLMIESHIEPDKAWSDARQQVTPTGLESLLAAITWRHEKVDKPEVITALEKLRDEIDHVDDELLELMSRRMLIADKIGVYKKQNNITILQAERWNEILERALLKAGVLGLSKEFLTQYFDSVHMESINHQNNIMDNGHSTDPE